jgi:hypothetical protein
MKMKTIYGFKRWPSVKSKDDPVPSQNQGVSDWTQGPRLPTKVSFKGGSHLGNLNPTFFLASPISGTRFLLRVVVCNIPRFYQILGEFFFFCFACVDWIFHRDLKLLSLFKSFMKKTNSNSLVILEELLWENESSSNNNFAHKSMQACLQRNIYKINYFIKDCIFKTKFER